MYRILKDVGWSGRCETPMGVAGRVRPRRLAEEAQLTPHGKGASCNGNQHSFLTESKLKIQDSNLINPPRVHINIIFKLTL